MAYAPGDIKRLGKNMNKHQIACKVATFFNKQRNYVKAFYGNLMLAGLT